MNGILIGLREWKRNILNKLEMNKYTIRYYYGSYSGIREIYADDEETAISLMWRMLRADMTLPMAYKSEEVIDVEYDAD